MGNVFGKKQAGEAPLVQPCLLKDKEEVEKLLKDGADVLQQDAAGNHALGAAACGGDLAVVELLLEQEGIEGGLDLKNGMGLTPVWLAAGYGHVPVLKVLLERGGSPLIPGSTGDTALIAAASKGHADVCALLLERGVTVASTNRGGDTAVSVAAVNGFAPVLKTLLGHVEAQGCQDVVNKPNSKGIHPLQAAASNGDAECVRLLLEQGANYDGRDKNGSSAAAVAAFCGNVEALRTIFEHPSASGMDLEATDEAGATVLWTAAAGGKTEAVALCLEKGCSKDATCTGMTAEAVAAKNGHTGVVELLKAQ